MRVVMKYRSRNEIVADILSSAKNVEGVTKTKIMYEAFLSFAQLKDYMSMLLENGMLEQTSSSKYRITDKDVRMLETYDRLNDIVGREVSGR